MLDLADRQTPVLSSHFMPQVAPTLLALDFDGVLCDGLVEYFQTTWKAYCQLWKLEGEEPPADLAPRFYRTRPVIETGWEMPLLMHALRQGIPNTEILQDWSAIASRLLQESQLDKTQLTAAVDGHRDRWIASDLPGWLSLHRFYQGTIERLRSLLNSTIKLVIITTKEERFARQLLQQQDIELPEGTVFGKSLKRPKHETLRQLGGADGADIWFVEDRLKTLQSVQQQSDLSSVKLFLADWGYNTATDRKIARNDPRIRMLSLAQLAQDFSTWL